MNSTKTACPRVAGESACGATRSQCTTTTRSPSGEGKEDDADVSSSSGKAEIPKEVYCICRQVSFGEMIACDGDNCKIEWFHLACVGFLDGQKPKGKWYCPGCAPQYATKPKPKPKAKPTKPKEKG